MICFEVSVAGERLTIAGIPGRAVLSTHITWVKRRPRTGGAESTGGLDLRVGGLDSNSIKQEEHRHLSWVRREVAPGDVVVVRILEGDTPDPPVTSEKWPGVTSPRHSSRSYLKQALGQRKKLDGAIARLKRAVRRDEKARTKSKSAKGRLRRPR